MGELIDKLIAWSIQQRIVVMLGALLLVVAGGWAASHASTDALPDFTPPRVVVQTEASGMSTIDVEELITRPVERVLLGTPDTTSVRSTSSPGLSVVTLMFEDSVDLYRARQLVAERLSLARLPEAASAPQLAPIQAPIGALLKLCLTSTGRDPIKAGRDMRTFADWTLRPRLLTIPGVAQVTALGGDVERVDVQPDPVRMRQRGITILQLADAVKSSQAISGAGFVNAGAARLDVKTDARLTLGDAVETLKSVVVSNANGLPIRVGEVADVVLSDEPRVGAALFDGRPAVFLQVTKLPWADTIKVTKAVEAAMGELSRALPPDMVLEAPTFRQASFIQTSMRSVGRAMAIGSLLVVVVLVAFLRSPRLAAISLTAIPLSILGAVLVLVWMGVTINGMTLGGLAISVGEVVDDAIVGVENVWRRLRENARLATPRPPMTVIRDASLEVRGSVIYATLIVGLVLLPVLLLGGIAGRIFSPLAVAYILAIAASLLVALTVTPAMCAWLLPGLATAEAEPTAFARSLLERYGRILRRVVEHPRTVFLTAAVLAVGSAAAIPFLGGRFLPEFREGTLIAEIQAAPGTSLEEMVRQAERIDAQTRPDAVAHTSARAGRAELDEDAAPVNKLEVDLSLKPEDRREAEEISADLASRIGRVPGLGFSLEGFLSERVHEILAGETSPVVVKIMGPDLATLRTVAARAARIMTDTPGLAAVRVEPQIDVPQIRIRPDYPALSLYGVRPLDLADEVVAWRHGRVATEILEHDGRVIDVAVAGAAPFRERSALRDLPIGSRSGLVNLSALATIDVVPEPAVLSHDNGERRISIGAAAGGAGLSKAVAKLEQRLESGLDLPHGFHYEIGGEAVARSEAGTRLLLVGAVVLLGIFVLLTTAFSSSRDAVVVLLNFPLGLVGGVVAAFFTPEGLSVAGFVGFVTLFGIIARNGIMLVSHKRHLDLELPGKNPVDRILQASEERLLPILMTAATAGLGLLPLALSFANAGSELEAPMALIVCGGLVSSTALNMLVLPTIYVWLARRHGAAA